MSGIYIKGMEMPTTCFHCWIPCEVPFEDRNHLSRAKNCPAVPAADVVERKKGEWNAKVLFYLKCSECGCCLKRPTEYNDVFLDK